MKLYLSGNSLKAETSGKEEFLKEEYVIALPASDGKYKTINVSVEELKKGIKL